MPNLVKLQIPWTGNVVTGGGVSTLYLDEGASGFVSAFATFFDTVKVSFPAGLTWTIPSSGDLVDVATGGLSGSWSEGSTTVVNATSAQDYAAGVGARIKWVTSGIVNGRRVRGSTFLCPLAVDRYGSDGSLDDAYRSAFYTAANTALGAITGDLMIWHRPTGGSGGSAHAVTSAEVPDQVSWLRSRRT